MQRVLIRGLFGSLVLVGLVAFAPTGLAATTTVEGSLTAVSGTTLPVVLTVQSGVTTYTVNVTTSTVLVRKFNGPSTLEEFGIGDLLRIEGTVTGTTIDATKIKNLSIQRKGSLFWGTILSIDATNKTFTIDPQHRKSLPDQTVITTASTKFFQGNRRGEFSDLAVGMNVRIVGLWRKSLNRITADRILIKLTEINGRVTAVDCTAKTMTVVTNKGKKSEHTWAVNLTDKTVIRDKNLNQITCADVKFNHRVHVRGLRTGTLMLNALQIWDRGVKRSVRDYEGTVLSRNTETNALYVQFKKNDDPFWVNLTADTIVVNDEGRAIAITDVAIGHKVKVKGVETSSHVITANLIMDKNLPAD